MRLYGKKLAFNFIFVGIQVNNFNFYIELMCGVKINLHQLSQIFDLVSLKNLLLILMGSFDQVHF
jgi:hypothetical protein